MSKDALPLETEITQSQNAGDTMPDLLTQTEHYLQQCQEQGEKVKINILGMKTYFLPSVEVVAQLFGGKYTYLNNLSMIEEDSGQPLSISRSGRYDLLGKKGIAARSAKKMFRWLKSVAQPFLNTQSESTLQDIERATNVGSNAADWIFLVNGFKKGYEASGTKANHELNPLLDFILDRCEVDVSCLELARSKAATQGIGAADVKAGWQLQIPLWLNHSFVSEGRLNEFTEVLGHYTDKKLMSDAHKQSLIRCYFSLYFDFYFGAISSYEVGCVLFHTTDIEEAKANKGILCRAILAYATDISVKTCFGALLEELESVVLQLVGSTGKREVASFIPVDIDKSKDETFTLRQKQYDRLKSWRSGRASPSDEVLSQFLGNLAVHVGKNNGDAILFICRIAISLDKEIKQLLKLSEKDYANTAEVEHELKLVLATYGNYYQRCLNRYIDQ